MIKNIIKLFTIFLLTTVLFAGSAFAQDMDERAKLLVEAGVSFLKGEYEKTIKIYDEILKNYPTDSKIFEMKGVALSNLRLESTLAMQPQQNVSPHDPSNLNKLSMLEFYKALEINPKSVLAPENLPAFDSPIFHSQHEIDTSTLFNVGVSPIVDRKSTRLNSSHT